MTAILDSNQCCRFCGPTPNHSDNGSYIYFAEDERFELPQHFCYLWFQVRSVTIPAIFQLHIYISCGSRRIRTFGTFRFGTLAVCWFKPLTHTSIQGIWYFNCCSLLQLICNFNWHDPTITTCTKQIGRFV